MHYSLLEYYNMIFLFSVFSSSYYVVNIVSTKISEIYQIFLFYSIYAQADNNMEYVIEAHDTEDMRSWLATIKYCMRSAPTSQPPPGALAPLNPPNANPEGAAATPNPPQGTPGGAPGATSTGVESTPPPELPPRRAGDCAFSNSNFELSSETMAEEPSETGKRFVNF